MLAILVECYSDRQSNISKALCMKKKVVHSFAMLSVWTLIPFDQDNRSNIVMSGIQEVECTHYQGDTNKDDARPVPAGDISIEQHEIRG